MPLLAPEGETRLEGKGRGNSLCGEEEDAEENPQWEPGLSARCGYILLLGCGLHPGRMEPRAVVRCPRGVDSLMKESEVPKRLCLIFTVCEVDGDKCWGGGPSALGQECSHLCVCVYTRCPVPGEPQPAPAQQSCVSDAGPGFVTAKHLVINIYQYVWHWVALRSIHHFHL